MDELYNRLSNMLCNDNKNNPKSIELLLKRDLYKFLSNYMELADNSLDLSIAPISNGKFQIQLSACAKRIIPIKIS